MPFHKKTIWLTASWVFIFTFIISVFTVAKAQAPLKDPIARELSKKKWKVIDGFRSAKFGMDEKQVVRSIRKDFKVPKTTVQRSKNSREKTTVLRITLPELLPLGGPAKINYIFGFKSKTLMHVSILWGKGAAEKVDAQSVVDVANFLRAHFLKNRYKKEKFVSNRRINDREILIFQGLDKKNRAIILTLVGPAKNIAQNPKNLLQEYSLQLRYILNTENPDIFNPILDVFNPIQKK
tara:strand:- start:3683 stop:4393 length:711 start_codon:yes stop_codon:yes gene_type:complete